MFFIVGCVHTAILIRHYSYRTSAPKTHVTSSHPWCTEMKSHSLSARSPWHHLCHLCHVWRQQPFLRRRFIPLSLDIQHTMHFILSYRAPFPHNGYGIGQPVKMKNRAWVWVQKITYYFDISHMPVLPRPVSAPPNKCYSLLPFAWSQATKIGFWGKSHHSEASAHKQETLLHVHEIKW